MIIVITTQQKRDAHQSSHLFFLLGINYLKGSVNKFWLHLSTIRALRLPPEFIEV